MGSKMVPRRHFFAACWRSVRSASEVNKTLHWLTKIEVRPSFDRTKKRRNFDAEAVRTGFGVPNARGSGSVVVRMARGGSPDAPCNVLKPSWGRPGRPESALGPSRAHPGPLRSALMASAARPRAPQGGRRWNFRAFSALWDRFSLLRTSFSTSFASIHASSNAGSAVLQAPCSKSPRSTSLRCDHASAPNSGKPLASQGTRPLIFERSRCLRHLYGSGPESPSSIFLRCVPGFAGQSSTVRADTYAEDSRLLLLRGVQASAPSIYIYIYIYIYIHNIK